MKSSLLEIVQWCNCITDFGAIVDCPSYWQLLVGTQLVGLIRTGEVPSLRTASDGQSPPPLEFKDCERQVTFAAWCDSRAKRTDAMAKLLAQMRHEESWASLAKWRDELYPIYGDPSDPKGIAVFIERASAANFGVRTFGVHINGIVRNAETGELSMWIARRSATKSMWPGYLDQVVAGGMGNGIGLTETVVKECYEEGGIPAELARTATCAGTIQYFTETDQGLQPETQFVYDLELPNDFVPRPQDGEVQEFNLWPIPEVIERIKLKQFKPNSAMCIVDFLIRRGYITPENEPDYLEIIDNIHVKLPLPGF
ncbi:hypothetical protein EV180_001143 [Coemansia sp. RSA 518]|nr:hypothetical protein IW142_000841 [Coemansia sp. RSA 564]KAJ2174877.1 hypothetical protein GGH16_001072 [Coemansia sp. RSA 560]KAJ2230134.1 hypothetical protein EV180_001143 [Coemansia sp. RSA 518]